MINAVDDRSGRPQTLRPPACPGVRLVLCRDRLLRTGRQPWPGRHRLTGSPSAPSVCVRSIVWPPWRKGVSSFNRAASLPVRASKTWTSRWPPRVTAIQSAPGEAATARRCAPSQEVLPRRRRAVQGGEGDAASGVVGVQEDEFVAVRVNAGERGVVSGEGQPENQAGAELGQGRAVRLQVVAPRLVGPFRPSLRVCGTAPQRRKNE